MKSFQSMRKAVHVCRKSSRSIRAKRSVSLASSSFNAPSTVSSQRHTNNGSLKRNVHTLNLHKKLPDSTMEVINATAPVVAENIHKITETFYPTMFKNNPETLQFFNMSNQRKKRQPHALAESVLAAVGHVQDLAAISPALLRIAHKHCALGVLPDHYQIVHDNFLNAVGQVLGDAVTPPVAQAWSEVLQHVSGACIDLEEQLYQEYAARPGNWHGSEPRDFVVSKAVSETPTVRSLYLKRADGSPAPSYSPGQYVTVHLPPGNPPIAPRHYTLSTPAPVDGCIRISVRHLPGVNGSPPGVCSDFLHNVDEGALLSVRPPFGTFTREFMHPPETTQEIYFTAGIGITKAASLMPVAKNAGYRTAHVHCGRHMNRHAFLDELEDCADHEIFHYDGGHPSSFLDVQKCVDELRQAKFTPEKNAIFMVCGPPSYFMAVHKGLVDAGVPVDAIHHEDFGPRIEAEE